LVNAAATTLLAKWVKDDVERMPRLIEVLVREVAHESGDRQERGAVLLAEFPIEPDQFINALTRGIENRSVPSPPAVARLAKFGKAGADFHQRLIETGRVGSSKEADIEAVRLSALAGVAVLEDDVKPLPELIAAVGEAAMERDDRIRNRALQTLRDLGGEAQPAAGGLIKLAKDPSVNALHLRTVTDALDNIRTGKKPKVVK
jgi:hypothetical protein